MRVLFWNSALRPLENSRTLALLLLIGNLITMVLISIHPFTARKLWPLILGLLCLFSFSCFAESVYLSVNSTPYDRQMNRISPVLLTKSDAANQGVSLAVVNHWIEDLRAIPYGFSTEWKTPQEVESAPVADCKGKAVALYQRLQVHGAEHVRLVIGKRTMLSRRTHAWIEWDTDHGTYVLDPTINWTACRLDRFRDRAYIPLYAYAGTHKYRATSGTLYARNLGSLPGSEK
jgi:predicted transglutaminase-like cysteine proteinase